MGREERAGDLVGDVVALDCSMGGVSLGMLEDLTRGEEVVR